MVTSESVKPRHTQVAGISVGECRTTPASRRVNSDAASKLERKDLRNSKRLPTPTRFFNDGHTMQRGQNRRVSVSPRKSTKSPFVIGHGSAPPGMERKIPDRASLRPVRIDKTSQLKQAIKFRQQSPPVRTPPKPITAESRSKSPATTFASDYSALRAMPQVMSTVRHVRASLDLAHCTVPDSVVLNNLHNVSSVDSTTQNNTLALAQEMDEDYDHRFKIGSDAPDSISWDARRRFLHASPRSPDDTNAFFQLTEETEDPDQGTPSSFTQTTASALKESQWKTPFWRLRPGRSRELPKAPVGQLLGLQKEASVDNRSEESLNDYPGLEGSASSNLSEGNSDVDERFLLAASRILGIPYKRRSSESTALRQSRGTDSSSQRSIDEPSSAPASTASQNSLSDKKKKSKVPKMVRRLGKTLAKKLTQTDGTKTANLKNIVRGFLSLQAVSLDDAVPTRQRLINGKSSSSENSSDCNSIDMDDIKNSNPELYSSIVETVAEWCEEPVAEPENIPDQLSARRLNQPSSRRLKVEAPAAVWKEDVIVGPDDKSEMLSARTFSSISFRERPGGSQDLNDFEVGSELAREEAFLTDVVEGRIDTRSSSSDSPRKRDDISALQTSRQGQKRQDQVCCPEMKLVLEAIDNLCTPADSANVPDNSANTSMEPSCLPFTDSESEDEKEPKDSANDFLHLTSSEIESFELDGLKKLLEMQGIWIFNWDRCAEIVRLSEEWKKSSALQKYVGGASGFEISMDEGTVKCYRYPLPDKRNEKPLEHVFLDGVPPTSTSSTLNLKGTLTTSGLRTTCDFPDGSQREELAWIERDGLCVQVSTELFSGERNVSRVYLKRPLFNSLD